MELYGAHASFWLLAVILHPIFGRMKLEHQDRKSRLTSPPDGISIRSGAPQFPAAVSSFSCMQKQVVGACLTASCLDVRQFFGTDRDCGIGAGNPNEPESAVKRGMRMVALTDPYIAYYQESLESHAEHE